MVGKFTEIIPARPTINAHRHPFDNVKTPMNANTADLFSKLMAGIITAAEQQTMNFYMNVSAQYHNDLGRQLFAEIGMVEEEHVTQYESLKDPNCTWLENWLMHEYTECYLYWSCAQDETDANIKKIWSEHFEMEVAHLKRVAELLKKYEKKAITDVIPAPEFPEPLKFGQNKKYIRDVITNTAWTTNTREKYGDARKLSPDTDFCKYNSTVNGDPKTVASHAVIVETIKSLGEDYRYQESAHPLRELDDRKKDNVSVGKC